jgi:hypothetical protein
LHQRRYELDHDTLKVDERRNIDVLCSALSERSMTEVEGERPLVEILYFDGCPNHEAARELVRQVSGLTGQPEERWIREALLREQGGSDADTDRP